jgi:hypothetical protein
VSARTLVLDTSWRQPQAESSFVMRALAGAASRAGPVTIGTPGPPRGPVADGFFDVNAVGGEAPSWPEPSGAAWPESWTPQVGLVKADDDAAVALLRHHSPGTLVTLVGPNPEPPGDGDAVVALSPSTPQSGARRVFALGIPVPVNPLAAERRHNALGPTGYILVLTDRGGQAVDTEPTALAAWLIAGFPQSDVVVIEGGSASLYGMRACRGVIAVDTRTDLWRLLAHARVVVDLQPGELVARECVEAMRFGVPVVVPGDSVAADYARAGAGRTFSDPQQLLEQVEALGDDRVHAALGEGARTLADARFGDPDGFVTDVAAMLTTLTSSIEG